MYLNTYPFIRDMFCRYFSQIQIFMIDGFFLCSPLAALTLYFKCSFGRQYLIELCFLTYHDNLCLITGLFEHLYLT